MPDIEWNKTTWSRSYDWSCGGEEWSGSWGTSSAAWFSHIMPRIGSVLPAQSVLEIAPGFGRWTEFLLRFCQSYCGVDLSDKCISNCRTRFSQRPNAEFFLNDGMSLAAVSGHKFDLVFSFDSLVHADVDVLASYVPQIIRFLAPGGIAFLHHSNLGALSGVSYGHRSENVSAGVISNLVSGNGGRVLVQERFCGGENVLSECFSMFCGSADYENFECQDITDRGLVARESALARERFQYYLRLR